MAAPKGNSFWEIRKTHGRDPIFSSPEQMWDDCCDYFKWTEDNPLLEEKAAQFQGVFVKDTIEKMRAMTIGGLCVYLGIGKTTWDDYKKKEGFPCIINEVEEIIRAQKFSGAAADLLNANIIARDLGLRDNKDVTSNGGSMAPPSRIELVAPQLDEGDKSE